jgi:hypothetical protein
MSGGSVTPFSGSATTDLYASNITITNAGAGLQPGPYTQQMTGGVTTGTKVSVSFTVGADNTVVSAII